MWSEWSHLKRVLDVYSLRPHLYSLIDRCQYQVLTGPRRLWRDSGEIWVFEPLLEVHIFKKKNHLILTNIWSEQETLKSSQDEE